MNQAISRRGWIVIFGVPALFFLAYVIALSPTLVDFPLCTVKAFLGIDCPGCGLTHSFAFLAHGQVKRSIDSHPLGIVIALLLIYVFLKTLFQLFTGRELKAILSKRGRDVLVAAFVIAFIGQWVIKLIFSLFTFNF